MRELSPSPLRWRPRIAGAAMSLPRRGSSLALVVSLMLAGCAASAPAPVATDASLQRIQTIVVIYAENHSFDNLYGLFPGADGIANATPEQSTQLDHDGTPLKEL